MKYSDTYVEWFENTTNKPVVLDGTTRVFPGVKIIKSTIQGPLAVDRNSRLGPEVVVGKYCGINESTYITRANVGAFCAIGARVSVNPFNHPTSWLSVHEFQYHQNAFTWVDEYQTLDRLNRTPDMFTRISVGNDVWIGHGAHVLGVDVGDGAVIGAGSVVTKTVPPYAIVAGVPATIKGYRFNERIIQRLLESKWWELELVELNGLPFRDIERCLDFIEQIRNSSPKSS